MQLLKQASTAQPLVFLLVDSTDHVTGKTGLTPTVTLSKAGGAFASPAGAVTEIGSGWYKCAGNATDTGTLGPLILHATGTAADPVDILYGVVAFDPQSAASLGLTNLDAAITSRLSSGAYVTPNNTGIDTLITYAAGVQIKLFGISSLAAWLGALAGKTADTDTRAEINGTLSGATYNETTDSLQAVRDRGDAAWTTGAGGGTGGATADELAQALAGQIPISVNVRSTAQHIDIYKADYYANADGTGRTLSFTFQTGEAWPDTISEAHFYCTPTRATLDGDATAVGLDAVACTVDVGSGSGRKVTLNLTSGQTDTLASGVNGYTFGIVANKSTHRATLRSGTMTVRPDPAA